VTAASPLLILNNVYRIYPSGDHEIFALDDVSLTVQAGEFLAVMGQSGSGKSTLMNIIGCLDKPSKGGYQVRGCDVSGLDSDELATLRRETFGFIFQRYNLLPTVSAAENVEIPAVYAGMGKSDRQIRSQKLLERLGMGDRSHHRPPQLSGGQQQRVAIARALMNDPPVILADEPTGALDSKSGLEVMKLLKELHAEGRTIILITHDKNVAENAERIVYMTDGKITQDSANGTIQTSPPPFAEGDSRALALLPNMLEAVTMAARSLRVNIFRTALTLLGIIIGVASVVAMLAIGDGSKQKVLNQIQSLGTNLLYVQPGAPNVRGGEAPVTMSLADAEAIQTLDNISTVVPTRMGRMTLRAGNIDYSCSTQGVGTGLPLARDWPVASGYFFTDRDMKSRAAVAVLGKTVKNTLFPNETDPIGRFILIKNIPFEVIGVMSEKGAAPYGGDQDDVVFVPITTAIVRLFGQDFISSITIQVTKLDKIDETQAAITSLIKRMHHTEDFYIRNMQSIMTMATEAQDTLTLLLGTIAAISLLVGGIGVMNIMLVSVTERTREIGIRMATGARMRDILLQFNIEAIVVCAMGGFLGLGLGFLVGVAVRAFGTTVIFSVQPALLAFTSAFATGVIFGYLPARKAARLDPVVALSSE
jgi:macrolide transport system ATP-binding/permease protein